MTLNYADKFAADAGVAELRERMGLPPIKKGTRPCQECRKDFKSPDEERVRICDDCKSGQAWQGSQEADSLYPSINCPREGKKTERGKQPPKLVTGKGRAIQAERIKRARTERQKQFGVTPLAKKRTRV
jgi:hypothetical protein